MKIIVIIYFLGGGSILLSSSLRPYSLEKKNIKHGLLVTSLKDIELETYPLSNSHKPLKRVKRKPQDDSDQEQYPENNPEDGQEAEENPGDGQEAEENPEGQEAESNGSKEPGYQMPQKPFDTDTTGAYSGKKEKANVTEFSHKFLIFTLPVAIVWIMLALVIIIGLRPNGLLWKFILPEDQGLKF